MFAKLLIKINFHLSKQYLKTTLFSHYMYACTKNYEKIDFFQNDRSYSLITSDSLIIYIQCSVIKPNFLQKAISIRFD